MIDENKAKLVSVAIPTYNRGKYICETLDSLKKQTYKNIEVIIVDDGSTDNTENIINEWRKNNLDVFEDFVYLKLPRNCDEEWAWNIGFSISRGEYIAIHSSDDISHEERIEKQVSFFINNSEVAGVGSGYLGFEKDINNVIYDGDLWIVYNRNVIERNYKDDFEHCVNTGTFMFKRSILDEIIGFKKITFGVNDAFFISDIIKNKYIIDNIKEKLYYTRIHEDQKSRKMSDENYKIDKWKTVKGRVSIVIPVNADFNGIIDTLESISSQTYNNIELIIVDDLEYDTTETIIKKWYSDYKNKNNNGVIKEFIYIKVPRKVGFSGGYNIGSYLSKGEYIVFHSDSDISNKYKIEKQVEFLKNDFVYSVVGTNYDGNYGDIKYDEEIEYSYTVDYMPGVNINTIMMRADVINETGGLNESMLGREGFEFIYRLINNNYKVQNLKEILYYQLI